MQGRIYAISPDQRILAIETEVHAYTIVEPEDPADVKIGDEISWETDLSTGPATCTNLSTQKNLAVIVRNHMISKPYIRQMLLET